MTRSPRRCITPKLHRISLQRVIGFSIGTIDLLVR